MDIMYDWIFFTVLWFISSRIVKTFENIDRLGILHVCSFEIVDYRVGLSLFEMILVRILNSTQSKDIGLQSYRSSFFSFFGFRVIIAWSIECVKFSFWKRMEL